MGDRLKWCTTVSPINALERKVYEELSKIKIFLASFESFSSAQLDNDGLGGSWVAQPLGLDE